MRMRWCLAAALVAAAASTGCGSDDVSTSSSPTGSASSSSAGSAGSSCVDTINALRAQEGLPALSRWAEGEACADTQAESDARANEPHGAFGKCGERAQNECPGWAGAPGSAVDACLREMWKQGPGEGHHDTMATKVHTQVACGFYTTPAGKVWSVQNFR